MGMWFLCITSRMWETPFRYFVFLVSFCIILFFPFFSMLDCVLWIRTRYVYIAFSISFLSWKYFYYIILFLIFKTCTDPSMFSSEILKRMRRKEKFFFFSFCLETQFGRGNHGRFWSLILNQQKMKWNFKVLHLNKRKEKKRKKNKFLFSFILFQYVLLIR